MEGSGVGGLHIQKYFKSYVIHWRKIQLSLQLQGHDLTWRVQVRHIGL